MTFDYSRSISTARRLIDKFGKNVVLVQTIKGGPAQAPTFTDVPTTLRAVDLNKEQRDKSGTLTGTVRRKLLIAGDAAKAPTKADTVTIDGTDYNIDFVKTLNPSDAIVLFEVYLVI